MTGKNMRKIKSLSMILSQKRVHFCESCSGVGRHHRHRLKGLDGNRPGAHPSEISPQDSFLPAVIPAKAGMTTEEAHERYSDPG